MKQPKHSNSSVAYWVYIVCCADGSYYTGITTDPERRVTEHNGISAGGARYTATRRPVALIYQSSFPDRSAASKEEARIKRLTRAQKQILIETAA